MEKGDEIVGYSCRKCGKTVMLQKDPECCACRYGSHAAVDYEGRPVDCVDFMQANRLGYRLLALGAFDLWAEDPANRGWETRRKNLKKS